MTDTNAAKVQELEGERERYAFELRAAHLGNERLRGLLADAQRDLEAAEDQASKNCDEVIQLRQQLEAARRERDGAYEQAAMQCERYGSSYFAKWVRALKQPQAGEELPDQGYTRIEDGCPQDKVAFEIVRRGDTDFYRCPVCLGYFGPKEGQ